MRIQVLAAVVVVSCFAAACANAQQQQATRAPAQRQVQQRAQQSAQQQVAAPADRTAEFEALVERLVLTDQDSTFERGQRYLKREATQRINQAGATLQNAGKSAWPVLMRHLDDKRPSLVMIEAIGPHDVGLMCHRLLRNQIVSLPLRYPRFKGGPEDELDRMFQPSLQAWLLARRDQPLEQMRVETMEYLITLERADARSRADDPEALPRLEQHLVVLKSRLAEVAR